MARYFARVMVLLTVFCFSLLAFVNQAVYADGKVLFGSMKQSSSYDLVGKIYFLPEGTEELPDFTKIKSIGTIYTKSLDIPERPFEEGFPGVTNRFEWFGICYTGKIFIQDPGEYTYSLLSDDGAKLFIDGNLLINNDGIHPPVEAEGTISLSKGVHTIRVEYFQGPRYEIALQLFITPPNGNKKIFSAEDYKRK